MVALFVQSGRHIWSNNMIYALTIYDLQFFTTPFSFATIIQYVIIITSKFQITIYKHITLLQRFNIILNHFKNQNLCQCHFVLNFHITRSSILSPTKELRQFRGQRYPDSSSIRHTLFCSIIENPCGRLLASGEKKSGQT